MLSSWAVAKGVTVLALRFGAGGDDADPAGLAGGVERIAVGAVAGGLLVAV